MKRWILDPYSSMLSLECGRFARLIGCYKSDDFPALADNVLATMRILVPVDHCTIFVYRSFRSPTLVSASSFSPEASPRQAAKDFQHDNILPIFRNESYQIKHGKVVLYQDRISEKDRVSVIIGVEEDVILCLNFFTSDDHGRFSDSELDVFCGLSPLLAQVAVRQYLAGSSNSSRYQSIIAQAIKSNPSDTLSHREQEVILRLLDGLTVKEISLELQISPNTVVTYRQRSYRKLGVGSRRELFASILASRLDNCEHDESSKHRLNLDRAAEASVPVVSWLEHRL